VHRAAQAAIASNEDLVIVMNTPGGLLANMQQIVRSIQDVQDARLAVYTYVPPVAFAASAGSYIALATNGIYMGSGSIIGPSTPFVVGGDPSEEQHVQNAMVAYIRSLAEKNGYNVTAAVDMAQNNTAYSAVQATSVGLLMLIIAAGLVILEVKAGHGFFAISGIALGLAGTYLLAYNVPYSPSPYGITQYVILGGTGALLVVAFLYLTRIRHALMSQPKLID